MMRIIFTDMYNTSEEVRDIRGAFSIISEKNIIITPHMTDIFKKLVYDTNL